MSGSVTMMLLLSTLATSFLVSLPLLIAEVDVLLLAAGSAGAGGDTASGVAGVLLVLGFGRLGPDTAEVEMAIRIR